MAEARPLCFVLMPFGKKPDPTGGREIDFDRVYDAAIRPAVEAAGMEPIRADEEGTGGIIHKTMFERLLLCRYAVADLTTGNANVFYELGVRHAARARTTVAICAAHQPMPFDLNHLRSVRYDLGTNNYFGDAEATALREQLTRMLQGLQAESAHDSPVFQLLDGWEVPAVDALDTEHFRAEERRRSELAKRIHRAKAQGEEDEDPKGARAALRDVRQELDALDVDDISVILDLLGAYRALKDWDEMIALCEEMPDDLHRQVQVRQRLAFAYNRRAGDRKSREDRAHALKILEELEEEQGANPETCGLMGRIFKDRWLEARAAGDRRADAHLRGAIKAYRRGFEADWRDVFPGINLVTLLSIKGDKKSAELARTLLPIVGYAAERRLEAPSPEYWDHATALEVAVLSSDEEEAEEHLDEALSLNPESWMTESTAGNLGLIRDAWREQGKDVDWLDELIGKLHPEARAES